MEDRDIQFLDITQPGQPRVSVINIYNDTPQKKGCILNRLRRQNLVYNHPTIITGDFNLHHDMWSAWPARPDNLTDNIVGWLSEGGFALQNPKGEVTHPSRGRRTASQPRRRAEERSSVIDLTFANGPAKQANIMHNWAIDPGLSHDSDHYAIKFVINHTPTEIPNVTGEKYSLKEVDKEVWKTTLEEELEGEKEKLEQLITQTGGLLSEVALDECEEALTKCVVNTISRAGKEKRPSRKAKPWWDDQLVEASERVARAREEQKAHQHALDHNTGGTIRNRIKRARNFFKRLCKIKRQTWAVNKLEETESSDIWGFQKWSKGSRNYPTPPISTGTGNPKAVSHKDKCEAIRKELYQPPPQLEAIYTPNLTDRAADDIPFTPITITEIDEAITSVSANTAPGPSQISYQAVKWAWQNPTCKLYIEALMRRCLETGYHPKSWRKAVAVVLRKPNKPDYSNPRAYRLITLLECFGKILEKIVARRLTFLAGSLNLVPDNQFGGRSNSSTADAILSFTNDVHCAWNHGKVTSALTFDIKGYFDFVNHDKLLCELRRKGIPLEYVKWVASFLSDRKAAVCLDGKRGEMAVVQNGIPQGSPISPILASFYSAPLLELFLPEATQATTPIPDKPTEVHMFMYVDDGMLFVSSQSLETNILFLHTAYTRADEWLRSAGLSSDYSKRELQHYSRRRSDGSPSMTFADSDGQERVVVPEATVRWLGVHFDRKLRFAHHVKLAASRGEHAVNGLTMLANTVKGLSQIHLRRLYLACVIPKILFACPMWANGTAKQLKPLAKVQRRALHLICAAFRTTPTEALELEASIPPIDLQIIQQTKRCGIRFNKLGKNNPIIQRLPDTWRNGTVPSAPPPLPPRYNNHSARNKKRTTTLLNIAKHTSPTHKRIDPFLVPPWRKTAAEFGEQVLIQPHSPPPVNEGNPTQDRVTHAEAHSRQVETLAKSDSNLVLYTDGSLMKKGVFRRAGAGVVMYHKGVEVKARKMGMGGRAEVYDAEIAALMIGGKIATRFARTRPEITHIHFFVDNSAAVRAIFDPKPSSSQIYAATFHHRLRGFLDNEPTHKLTIAWCPSHSDITGNERADELAKEANELTWSAPIGTTRANAIRRAKERTQKDWRIRWLTTPRTGGFAISNRLPPCTRPTKRFSGTPREVFGRLIQCRTGHAYTGEFRRRFFPDKEVDCPCGEAEVQSRHHILTTCTRYTEQWIHLQRISRDVFLPEILGTEPGIRALISFLTTSGAFTVDGHCRDERHTPTYDEEPEVDDEDDDD